MKSKYLALFLLVLTGSAAAQKEVLLPTPLASDLSKWSQPERRYVPESWQSEVITNVSKPSLFVYLPKREIANGTAVIICPGGGFWALSINGEGIDLAKWLNERGIAAFVLKYRLVPSKTNDAVKEVSPILFGDVTNGKYEEASYPYVPLAISDGATAIEYVRKNAKSFNILPNKLGIIGFSAGGTIAADLAFNFTAANRPDFVAPIYPLLGSVKGTNMPRISTLRDAKVPADAPPLFIAATSNDGLRFTADAIEMYKKWLAVKRTAEIHIYSKGGHGFGMRKQNLPSDTWVESFYAFLKQEIIK